MSNDTQMIISVIIFLTTYVFIVWEKFDRAVVALTGASLMLFFRIMNQEKAIQEIDFNTIGLLIGMMVIVLMTKKSGVFEYLALKMVKIAKAEPLRLLALLSIITGILSALLDNVTTILLILPVTLSVTKDLKINPFPFIFAEIFASNVGGTATLVGDPPNIIIGSGVGLSFSDFLLNTGVIAIPLLFLTTYIVVLIYKKKLSTSDAVKKEVLAIDEKQFLTDKTLLIKSTVVLVLVVIGFLMHGVLGYESATVAVVGAVLLMLIAGADYTDRILHEIEWKTIFFFIGLFVLVGGIKETGVIKLLAEKVLDVTNGDLFLATMAILWVSAIASAFIDNIPFVTTMIPLLKHLGTISGMNLWPLWWALSLGACLGGNGTIVGASANVIAIGIAEEHGHKISFGKYFKVAFPLMILTIAVSTVYVYFRYF